MHLLSAFWFSMARKIKSLGLRHYGAKTVDVNAAVDWESLIAEIFVGFLLGVFAYMGYVAKIPLLFFPCLIGSIACLFAIATTVAAYFKRKSKRNKNVGRAPES
ncbi:hypothetical protein [Microbulbifer donghaiensis]|uniref:hypothetical protein n=1 Tax=Microbulbifer donghaiensis TaxID=494016 RepID=UPI0011613836|nr:hypothetical protein [Microbulbifer donghaiensis]